MKYYCYYVLSALKGAGSRDKIYQLVNTTDSSDCLWVDVKGKNLLCAVFNLRVVTDDSIEDIQSSLVASGNKLYYRGFIIFTDISY